MIWALAVASALATVPSGLRWLRVAQREHYLPGSATRFAWRWWTSTYPNLGLLGLAVAGVVGSTWQAWLGFLVVAGQAGPIGFPLHGVTSPLSWTWRLRRVATFTGVFLLAVYLTGALLDLPVLIAAGLIIVPPLVDLALLVLTPVERLISMGWVDKASRRLEAVAPVVVAITGSYGKTTTKTYLAHLIGKARRTVASPASFNNRLGLARAINEGLTPGTQVFIAEMGTYGPGEIADLCRWLQPSVVAITALGPVHLERFGTEERILEAKAEILEGAEKAVIVVDHPLLADLATRSMGRVEVIEVSTGERGRVRVRAGEVWVDHRLVGGLSQGVFESNLAAALGLGSALGVEIEDMMNRLPDLPVPDHRQNVVVGAQGVKIIDDTFNSNPDGARRGLRLLSEIAEGGSKTVVTPGMIELGRRQPVENEQFAEQASRVADHLVVVGTTNQEALLRGWARDDGSVTVVGTREQAVAWVRDHLGPGDAVLYENDLPDHYP